MRTEEEKRIDRIMANRRSAKESRERKKRLQENLEISVSKLTKENEKLSEENKELRDKLKIMESVDSNLRGRRYCRTTTTTTRPARYQNIPSSSENHHNNGIFSLTQSTPNNHNSPDPYFLPQQDYLRTNDIYQNIDYSCLPIIIRHHHHYYDDHNVGSVGGVSGIGDVGVAGGIGGVVGGSVNSVDISDNNQHPQLPPPPPPSFFFNSRSS